MELSSPFCLEQSGGLAQLQADAGKGWMKKVKRITNEKNVRIP